MVMRVVKLGSPRAAGEGLRIGTVRRPPRGVPRDQFAARDYYDVWYPNLAPSLELMKLAQAAATPAQWATFVRRFRAELAAPERIHDLELLAALSHHADFAIGCYCADEAHCHRSVLRELLAALGARIDPARVQALRAAAQHLAQAQGETAEAGEEPGPARRAGHGFRV